MADWQAHFASALTAAQAPMPTEVMAAGQDVTARWQVYRNNVMASLIAALADPFPVTQALVGEDFFRAMAKAYIQQQLPTSPLLVDYGEDFADFIAAFTPAAGLPYLADLARLERLRVDVYHAADAPGIALTTLYDALANPATLSMATMSLHPSVRLFRSEYAVLSLWLAHQQTSEQFEVALTQAENILLLRLQAEVVCCRLSDADWQFVVAIARGMTLGEAMLVVSQQTLGWRIEPVLTLLIRYQVMTGLMLEGVSI
jgi:hypothetical protein